VTPLGNDAELLVVSGALQTNRRGDRWFREVVVDPKGSKASIATDVVGVHAKNAINIAMEDLSKEDRKGIVKELEEEMAERRRYKLACFQKT
jgi:hypothetical protein